jgi:hypothetical protein
MRNLTIVIISVILLVVFAKGSLIYLHYVNMNLDTGVKGDVLYEVSPFSHSRDPLAISAKEKDRL